MIDRMDAIEASQRTCSTHVIRDDNNDEEVDTIKEQQEEQITIEQRMIKVINKIGGKPKLDTLVYFGSLNPEELIDQIGEIKKIFEFEKIRDPRRVRFSSTKLRIHASLWWNELQLNKECSGREKIKTWDRMVLEMKRKFFLWITL